jgi:hypothetical protein
MTETLLLISVLALVLGVCVAIALVFGVGSALTMRSESFPPAELESLLGLLVKREDLESVTATLLDQYRKVVRPTRGKVLAKAWYLVQVAGFLLQATWPWTLAIATTFIARDVLMPFTFGGQTEHVFMAVTCSLYVLAGVYSGARTKQALSGALVATTAHVCSMILLATWWVAKAYLLVDVMKANPYLVAACGDCSGETLARWVLWDRVGGLFLGGALFSLVAFACGSIGGSFGSLRERVHGVVRANHA